MTAATTPQQQAARVLVEKFKAHHTFGPAEPRDHSTLVVFQEEDGSSMRALSFGEIVDCLADAGLLCSSPVVQPKQDEEGSLRSEPSAALVQIPEAVFLGVVRASGDWENWDGNQIAAAVDRARRVLRSEGIEVAS